MRAAALKWMSMTVMTSAVLLAGSAVAEAPSPRWLTRPCEYEDSVNCYWDAGDTGNGGGHSFFAVRVRDQVCVLYGEDRYARRHNHCAPLR
jgi:hypothetical protein